MNVLSHLAGALCIGLGVLWVFVGLAVFGLIDFPLVPKQLVERPNLRAPRDLFWIAKVVAIGLIVFGIGALPFLHP